jgi:glutamate carboxypeptidase
VPRLDEALQYLAGRREAMAERLSRWCDQNSGSYHRPGLDAMAELLCEDYGDLGHGPRRTPTVPFTTVEDDGTTRQHQTADILRWDAGEEAERRVLLMIHYDTVYPPGSQPSGVTRTPEDRLVGPGTADAKGGLLVMLEALSAVRRFELDRGIGWTAIANPDEEIGSPASTPWMREHARLFDFGLLFEPPLPDGAMVAARKGSGNFTIVVRGRSAHAGRNPEQGRNAVVKLCQVLTEIDRLPKTIEHATINVARVHGGSALNRVPDLAVGRFNARVLDHAAQQAVIEAVDRCIAAHNRDGEFRLELSGGFQSPPKTHSPQLRRLRSFVSDAATRLGRELRWRDTGGACDGSKLADAGLANIDTLGPQGDRLHSPDEWVDLNALVPAAQLVATLLHDYASRERTLGS